MTNNKHKNIFKVHLSLQRFFHLGLQRVFQFEHMLEDVVHIDFAINEPFHYNDKSIKA